MTIFCCPQHLNRQDSKVQSDCCSATGIGGGRSSSSSCCCCLPELPWLPRSCLAELSMVYCYRTADVNPASEAYQKLMKESAALAPLSEGYLQLQQLQGEVKHSSGLLYALPSHLPWFTCSRSCSVVATQCDMHVPGSNYSQTS